MAYADKLSSLRQEIRKVDDAIFRLLAQRLDLARKIGKVKLAQNLPIKDRQVEKEVMAHSRDQARELGIYQDFAQEIAETLIKYSCCQQNEFQSRTQGSVQKPKKQVLIIGGLGQMGQWLAQFLESFGHGVTLYDQKESSSQFTVVDDLSTALKAEIIILTTPISATAKIIEKLTAMDSKALIFDICSLKSPLLKAIDKATKNGLRITSIHPMFGPDVENLVGRNILLCENESKPELTDLVADLFLPSTANLVRLPLTKHDEFISYVLGLSHLLNLLFANTLSQSGTDFNKFANIGSTTFNSQVRVTQPLVTENQDMYYEIQTENQFTPQMLNFLKNTLENYTKTIVSGNREGFKKLMEEGRQYFCSTPKCR